MGLTLGVFILAFNISSYLLNSFRFPFLATLSRTFLKYSLNNSIIPILFIVIYLVKVFKFQRELQYVETSTILLYSLVFILGIAVVLVLGYRYFILTNKDIYKMHGIQSSDNLQLDEEQIAKTAKKRKKHQYRKSRGWRVDNYFGFPLHLKAVRSIAHYKVHMLDSVFKQNHINAAFFEIFIFVTFIALGLFRDNLYFRIPAAGSIILLFTIIIMLSGVLRFWLRGWASTAILAVLLLLNSLTSFEFINPRNQAYGLDYSTAKTEYSNQTLSENSSQIHFEEDVSAGIEILENWKAKWTARGVEKPKILLLNTSGGGVRSMVFTFRTLQVLDSTFNGELMNHTHLITGSSGGMISAAYYRQLYIDDKDVLLKANRDVNNQYLKNIGKDMLNGTAFSAVVGDLFLNSQKFTDGDYKYIKDRAYAFEQQLHENTDSILDTRLVDYLEDERNSKIPMMVITPTIVNDGRALFITPQPSSYLINNPQNTDSDIQTVVNGVEFSRFFHDQNALNVKMTSVLRMNATFPYITPPVSLPSEPALEVMDAGIRDNYGLTNSVRFLYTFKDWIEENTSGVVLLQIRDSHKEEQVQDNSIKTIFQKLTTPFRNISGNFLVMQDYIQDTELQYAKEWFNGPLDIVHIQMPYMKEKIALNWHLTNRDKNHLIKMVLNEENRKSLDRLIQLLENDTTSLANKSQESAVLVRSHP
ncbi:MAG: patatin-like phospholipase family protein [Bacteroidia bacterium]|nr:patatin-like phospholipase family protein [Bacteroidia bacterium]